MCVTANVAQVLKSPRFLRRGNGCLGGGCKFVPVLLDWLLVYQKVDKCQYQKIYFLYKSNYLFILFCIFLYFRHKKTAIKRFVFAI
jgi:hypothetical protein